LPEIFKLEHLIPCILVGKEGNLLSASNTTSKKLICK